MLYFYWLYVRFSIYFAMKESQMSITILNYHDQALIDQINAQAAERAAAKKASSAADGDFSSTLDEASRTYASENLTLTDCSADLNSIFEEAASTFGVSVNLLKSIARAESNFNPNAVSHAGAIGIMQLMPATAASLGVSNSYDPRENIMGGAKLISQLLSKYNGNTSLALAAYNAGSGNVDKYGGIPPFTETQNYVKKVLSYMNAEVKNSVSDTISNFLASNNVSSETVDLLVSLINLVKDETTSSDAAATQTPNTMTATVVDGSHIVNPAGTSASGTGNTGNADSGSADLSGNVLNTPSADADAISSDTPANDTTDGTTSTPSADTGTDSSDSSQASTDSANNSKTPTDSVNDSGASTDSTSNSGASTDSASNSGTSTDTTGSTTAPTNSAGNSGDSTGSVTNAPTDSDAGTDTVTDSSGSAPTDSTGSIPTDSTDNSEAPATDSTDNSEVLATDSTDNSEVPTDSTDNAVA